MSKNTLICDLRTCQAVAGTLSAMQPKVNTLYWLPEPIYHQLTQSDMKHINKLIKRRIVSLLKVDANMLHAMKDFDADVISTTDYFVVMMAVRHQTQLLCTPDWYRTVSSRFKLPPITSAHQHQAIWSQADTTHAGVKPATSEITLVLLITTHFNNKPFETK